MTGYGRAHAEAADREVAVEIKSVNSKAKEVLVKASETFPFVEEHVRRYVAQHIARGRVFISIRFGEYTKKAPVGINEKLIKEYACSLGKTAKKLGLTYQCDLKDLLLLPGVLETPRDETAQELYARAIEKIASLALERLAHTQKKEGLFLEKLFLKELRYLERLLAKARACHQAYVVRYKAKLKKEISALIGSGQCNELFPRLQQEISSIARTMDVAEECDRLQAHIAAYRRTTKEFPCGKKLDFIIQEMHREVNTLSQKASLDLSTIAVEMKSSVERMREQVQNVQ